MSGAAPPVPTFELVEHHDLIALPGRFCLYDAGGHRVEATRHYTFNRYIGADVVSVDVDVPLEVIERTVVYGGLIPKPHFGHFLMEAFTRLWPYDADDLREVPHAHHLHWRRSLRTFESELMEAATRDVAGPLLRLDEPTLLRRVLVPTQSIVLEQPIPERAMRVYDRIREVMVGEVVPSRTPLYLSRRLVDDGRRRTLGEASLEGRLAAAGYRIVHPQKLSLAEQIQTVAGAPIVAGLFGSALHLTAFRDLPGARTIALNPSTPSRIQQEIDRVRGAETIGIRAEYPIHPRHPMINGGDALRIGPYRNFVLPGRAAERVLARTTGGGADETRR